MNPSKAFRTSVKTTLGTPVEWYRDTDMGQRWFKDLWGNIIIKGENTMAEKTHTRINQFNWKDGWIKRMKRQWIKIGEYKDIWECTEDRRIQNPNTWDNRDILSKQLK